MPADGVLVKDGRFAKVLIVIRYCDLAQECDEAVDVVVEAPGRVG